ncbi:putative membrane protein [Rhizobium paknamense]|uniref:Membrane protein n=1 Tax=Rhizobium paknamense TaxID=1206817 RepID=A0ABU0ICI8_9HYPH|nr:heparan-alpha-glucosaminide N-acetyltransferase [Rhizobium paknamense]MDQ0455958.1 putative membrane protein [Rhizobium paknamense]
MTVSTPTSSASRRITLLDGLRGLALIAMASYHFTWDLEFFGYVEEGTAVSGPWKYYARGIASTFLFLVGVSLVLAHGRGIRWQSFGKRLGQIAAAAVLISVATYFTMGAGWIFFGILHAIAVTSLAGLLFVKLPEVVTLAAALGCLWLGAYGHSPLFDTPALWWLGLSETLPRSNDYVPVFPWFAAVLFGIAAARLALRFGWTERLAGLPGGPRLLQWAGRHSLIFYLVHQPVLISLVYLASLVAPPPAPDPALSYSKSCQRSCVAGGNEARFCNRFCSCTLEKLQQQQLLAPLQSGAIIPEQDDRVLKLARECTIASP